MITLNQINNYLNIKREQHPLFYVFFKTDEGHLKNIIFQNGCYFTLINKDKLLRLNPLDEVEVWVNKLIAKEYDLIGKGYLKETLPVNKRTLITRRQVEMMEYV